MWLGLAQGSQACADLAAKIEAALLPLGFPPGDKAFIPHLTLGRIRWSNSGQDWGKALEIMLKSEWETVLVDRFILWRSMLGQGTSRAGAQPGPVYLPLRAYPASG